MLQWAEVCFHYATTVYVALSERWSTNFRGVPRRMGFRNTSYQSGYIASMARWLYGESERMELWACLCPVLYAVSSLTDIASPGRPISDRIGTRVEMINRPGRDRRPSSVCVWGLNESRVSFSVSEISRAQTRSIWEAWVCEASTAHPCLQTLEYSVVFAQSWN